MPDRPPSPAGLTSLDARVDTQPSAAPFQTRARSRYDVLGEHGRGGLGVVKRALDTELRRTVAIKELRRRGASIEARFFREALITAQLEHPGIVPVHEAGRWPDGTPFYAMKLVSGRPLAELIARATTPIDRLGLLSHVIAVADAIAYAHDRHVIHRDLKPSNIIVGDFGETVVIDWGLAKDLRASDVSEDGEVMAPVSPDLTALGSVMGTPAYMAPEQAQGAAVDARADVFALGAILHELVVGRPPGADAADPSAIRRQLERARVPADLRTIITTAIACEPEARYASAAPLADDLRRYDRGARVAAHRYTWQALLVRFARRHRVLVGVSLVFAAVLVVGAAAGVRRIRSERDLAVGARAEAVTERNRVIRIHAESSLATDPTSAAAWLKRLPADALDTPEARQIALRARALGVATQVLELGVPVPYVSFTPDGSHLVTCGSGTLTLWRSDGTRVRTAAGDCHSRLPVAADGSEVYFSESPGGLGAWDLRTGERRVVTPSAHPFESILTAADGQVIAGLTDGSAMRGTIAAAPTPWPHPAQPRVLADSGRWLVSIDAGGAAWLTDLRTDRPARLSGAPVRVVRFADGERVLVVQHIDGSVGSIALDDPALRERRWDAAPTEFMSAGGRVAALLHRSETVSLWDVRTGMHLADVARVPAPSVLRVSRDGAWIAVGSKSGPVLIYQRATGRSVRWLGHRSRISDIFFQPGGPLVATASSDGTVRLWRLPDAAHRVLDDNAWLVHDLAVSPDRRQIAAADDEGGLRLYSPGAAATALTAHIQPLSALSYAPGGERLAARWADGRAAIVDPRTGAMLARLDDEGAIHDVAFAPDGLRVAIARADGLVVVRGLAGERAALGRHLVEARWVRFLDDDTVVSIGVDGAVIAWDRRSGHHSPLYSHARRVLLLEVAPGSRLITAGADGAVVVWSRSSGAVHLAAGGRPRALAVSPDGARLMIADASGEVRSWSLSDLAAPPSRFRYPSPINDLCFLDDGSAFGASDDGALLAWRDGALVDVWTTDVSGNTAVACRPTVDTSVADVTTATRDGKIVAWPVAPPETLASVRAFLDNSTRFELSSPDSSP